MAGRIRLGRKGSRIAVVVSTTAFLAGLAVVPGQTFGGSCNGHLSSVGHDSSHEKGPVTIDASDSLVGVTIIGSKGNDTIIGSNFDDYICGGGGDDIILSNDATNGDVAWGEKGDDSIAGGNGDDLISGGPGDDFIFGDTGEDKLFGDKGDDHLNGHDSGGSDNLKGGAGHNFCEVDAADDPEDCSF